MRHEVIVNKTKLVIMRGDIAQQDTEAIVNAANSMLMGGGGVDGAIHKAGGPAILEECKKIIAKIGKLDPGNAVITSGGQLPAKFVVHTVGPIWNGGKKNEDIILKVAYLNSLKVALDNGIKSISFPSISTGAYRFPVERAAQIAVNTIKEILEQTFALEEVRIVLFSEIDYQVFLSKL